MNLGMGLGGGPENVSSFKNLHLCGVADPDPGSGAFLTPVSGIRDG
jgi:hypothetical protein